MKLSMIPTKHLSDNKPYYHFNTFSKSLKIDTTNKKQLKAKISKTANQINEQPVQFKYISWYNMNEFPNPNDLIKKSQNQEKV